MYEEDSVRLAFIFRGSWYLSDIKVLTLKNFKITEEILKLSSLKFLELINCDFSGNLTPKETVSDAPLISCLETLYRF